MIKNDCLWHVDGHARGQFFFRKIIARIQEAAVNTLINSEVWKTLYGGGRLVLSFSLLLLVP